MPSFLQSFGKLFRCRSKKETNNELHILSLMQQMANQINHIETLENPYASLLRYRQKTNATIILKDAVSFLMYENDIYINYNPRESMGKAGMGDVFAGFIGALLARRLNILDASKLALIIQAKSFNILSKKFGNDYVQPKDLANISYKILKRI